MAEFIKVDQNTIEVSNIVKSRVSKNQLLQQKAFLEQKLEEIKLMLKEFN